MYRKTPMLSEVENFKKEISERFNIMRNQDEIKYNKNPDYYQAREEAILQTMNAAAGFAPFIDPKLAAVLMHDTTIYSPERKQIVEKCIRFFEQNQQIEIKQEHKTKIVNLIEEMHVLNQFLYRTDTNKEMLNQDINQYTQNLQEIILKFLKNDCNTQLMHQNQFNQFKNWNNDYHLSNQNPWNNQQNLQDNQ